jgi:P2-related tail formation protein
MSDLLVPPLAVDDRSRAIDALAARMTGLDLTPILVYLIDLVPADALPILAEQFNVVGPLWAYLPDEAAKRRAIKESVAWHRAKGTPWSVETALSWAGHVAKVEDTTGSANRWAEYQLELGTPVTADALQAVLELARFAAPARSHLVRLYGGYDRRVLHASTGDCWSDAFLSDDSGVWIDGVKLSFGRSLLLAAARPDTPAVLRLHRLHALRALYPDILRWGTFAFGDEPVRNHPVMHGRLVGLGNRLALLDPVSLTGRWRMARAAVPLSEDALLGEPNTRFGGTTETSVNRFFWSDPGSMLSAFDPGRIRTPIDEVFVATHRLVGVAGQPVRAAVSRHALHASGVDWRGPVRLDGTLRWSDAPLTETTGALTVTRQHAGHTVGIGERAGRYGWSGGWDNRRWGGDLALNHQTLTS